MEIIAVIPARGGSKGIPGKNIVSLAGKHLIAYTIEAAETVQQINRVIISTDSTEIADVAEQTGAEVIHRPSSISGDSEPSETALLHVLQHLKNTEGYEPELLVFLQCTSPLILPEDIEGTINALVEQGADSALAVAPSHRFLWKSGVDGAVGINHDKTVRLRRQDMEAEYVETGAVYVMQVDGFLKAKHRFFGKTVMHVIPAERTLEIDEPVDLKIAEVLLRERQREERAALLPHSVAGIVFDFDGVFTDNKVYVTQEGTEAVRCDRGDGYGIGLLHRAGIPLIVLSKEQNPVVAARCRKLDLDCIHGLDDKLTELKRWAETRNLPLSQIIYVGNDINDLECMAAVGCAVCPSDAHAEVKPYARIILSYPGGRGAIRELSEIVIRSFHEIS